MGRLATAVGLALALVRAVLAAQPLPPELAWRAWFVAALEHRPGVADQALVEIGTWGFGEFDTLRRHLRDGLDHEFDREAVRQDVIRRGILLHTDIALLRPDLAVRFDRLQRHSPMPMVDVGREPQQVDYAAFEEIPLNVVFVLDMSVSVSGERLGHLQEAGAAVLEGLKAGDQAALVTFDHAVVLRAPLTGDRGRVREALLGPPSAGMTSLIDATYAGMIVAESDVGRGLVLVFSDGLDVSSWLRPDLVREVARRSNAVVYGVVVRSPARPEFLSEIGRLSGGDVFEVESTRNLHQTFMRVLDEFRHRYLVSYQPRGVPRGGWHPLEVRVKKAGASVKARPGYLAGR